MQTVTEILIDFSTSMGEKLSMTETALLNDVLPNLDYSARIGIKTFSATGDKNPIIKTILPLSITNKEQIITAINSLGTPDGNTPIAAAIKNSVSSLREYSAFDKKIILITDGEENCDGNYAEEVNIAKTDGIDCQIHIIGIGLTVEATKQAMSISTASNGSFSSIPFTKGTIYNQISVKQNLSPFYTAVRQQTFEHHNLKQPVVEKQTVTQATDDLVPIESVQLVKEVTATVETPAGNENAKNVHSSETDEALSLIMREIKEIKNQLNDLRKDNQEAPEIEDIELNERTRKASEEHLFEVLKRKYPERVKWLNEKGESYSDHDFEIHDLDGSIEYFIECKGTPKMRATFYLTKDEWRLFLKHTKNYQIYFIKNSFSNPTPIFIDNLMDWLLKGKIVPYLKERQVIKEDRVFLTLNDL